MSGFATVCRHLEAFHLWTVPQKVPLRKFLRNKDKEKFMYRIFIKGDNIELCFDGATVS